MQYFVITFRRTAMSQNTVLLHNRYRVRSILGTGGFSTIYLAVDETTGTEVSVKEFTAEHMDGLATALRVNAYDIANRSEPQPVPDPSDLSGEEKRTLIGEFDEVLSLSLLERAGEALKKEKALQEATLSIKKRYGKNAILKGINFEEGATARDRNRQIGGHKA